MNGEPSTSSKRSRPNDNKKDGKRPYRHHNHQPKDDAGATGISKLKASLRQTRRLLAKDTLAPNVRVQTERRLKSLEGDLARAELASKERAMVVKYHRVKFFDRQKITRKIRQIKKQLSDPSLTSKKERKNLEETLSSLRVDLNYVLHYPKLEKYISLFPPEARSSSDPSSSSTTPLPIPPPADLSNASETDKKREELREEIRRMMREGGDGVSLTPEEEREGDAKGGKKEASVKKDMKRKVEGKKKVGDSSEGSDEESDEEDADEDVEMDEPDVGEGEGNSEEEEEKDARPKKKSKSDRPKTTKPPPQSTTSSSDKKTQPASKTSKDKSKYESKSNSKSKADSKPSKAKAVSKPVEEEKDDFFMDDSD